jgi:hypothetical protein
MSFHTKKRKAQSIQRSTSSVRHDGVLTRRLLLSNKASTCNSGEYTAALVAPMCYAGGEARVPDLVSYPTQTSSLQLEINVPANTDNAASPTYSCGGQLLLTTNGPRYYQEGYDGTSYSTDTAFVYKTVAVANNNTWSSNYAGTPNTLLPGTYNLSNTYAGYRIVGAGMVVEFCGNDQNNQGEIAATFVTSLDYARGGAAAGAFVTMQNFRNNYCGAAKKGASCRFTPIDEEDLVMGTASVPQSYSVDSVQKSGRRWYQEESRDTAALNDTKNYGILQWHATGIASSATFRVSIRIHIEGLVTSEYTDIDTGRQSANNSQVLDSSVQMSSAIGVVGPANLAAVGKKGATMVQNILNVTGTADAGASAFTEALTSAATSEFGKIAKCYVTEKLISLAKTGLKTYGVL